MTLLFISAYDSMNYVLANCAREAKQKYHKIIVAVNDKKDSRNNKMYFKKNIQVISVDKFDYAVLDEVDLVISAPVRMLGFDRLFAEVRKRNLFLVSFASLFSSVVMREYPDLVLCLGTEKFREFRENNLKYNLIATGNPQYDELVEGRKATGLPIENVLIIDQGGYPYGAKGKAQLADTLVKITEFHQDKQFYIKPRYGGREDGRMTHSISEQLIDYIQDSPQNLHVLDGSEILEDIIFDYDAMITTWSTAYADAVMLNIPLLLIGGLDSVDVFDVRKQRVEEAYRHLESTGCLYNYWDLQERRIEFEYVAESYIEKEFYNSKIPCAGRIIELLEFINKMLLKNGLRIKGHIEADLGGFYREFSSYKKEAEQNPEVRQRRRYLEKFNTLIQEWVYINRCMGNVLRFEPLYELFDMEFADTENVQKIQKKLKAAEKTFRDVQDDFFRDPAMLAQINEDRILQDFYFDWLYENRDYEQLLNFRGNLIAPESRLYNMALFELGTGERKKAYLYLGQFLELIEKSKAPSQLLKEKRLPQKLMPFCKGKNLVHLMVFTMNSSNRRRLFKLVRQQLGGISIIKTGRIVFKNKTGI